MKNQILQELRVDLKSDEWGNTMIFRFAIAAEMWMRGIEIPAEWQYSPGMVDDPRDADGHEFDTCASASDETLEHAGNVLFRYANLLERHGRDY